MDMDNMSLLLRHSGRMARDLRMKCSSREYRKRLRRAARKPVSYLRAYRFCHVRTDVPSGRQPAADAPSLNSQRLVRGMSVAQRNLGVRNFLFSNRDHRVGRPRSHRLVLLAQWNVECRHIEVSRTPVYTRLTQYGEGRKVGTRDVVDALCALIHLTSFILFGELLLLSTLYLPY